MPGGLNGGGGGEGGGGVGGESSLNGREKATTKSPSLRSESLPLQRL